MQTEPHDTDHGDDHTHTYDVAIAGAGPVGLFLACELRLAGASVLVLEQAAHAGSPLKELPFGMRGLSHPSIQAFEHRGLLDGVRLPPVPPPQAATHPDKAASGAAHWMHATRQPGGHFAGIQFFHDRIDTAPWPYHLPGPGGTHLATSMAQVESALAARALALGVQIRHGQGVEGFAPSDEAVTVQAGGQPYRARWLVGCDGGRSTVRKAGGFGFTGTGPEFTGYSAQVRMDAAEAALLAPGRHYTPTGMYTCQHGAGGLSTIALVDFDGGAFHRSAPITLGHVQAVLRHVSGTGVTLAALDQATTWTDRAFQATTYRQGRVLLAGDAAHTHSPLGGQGLNLGLGDAMNLGWKLAATLRGGAPDTLLDTYTAERHPVAAQVLDWSRAQVALMRPSPASRALAAIVRDLVDTGDGATYFARRVWGTLLRYDLGSSHPLAGRNAPDFLFDDGTRLAEHLRGGRGLLLDFAANPAQEALARRWGTRIGYLARRAQDPLGLNALLLRPDGVVAWAADDDGTTAQQEGLAQAAARWFGQP